MSIFDQTTKGVQVMPLLALFSGTKGIGKSTWASQAPNPVFIGAEEGTYNLPGITRTPKLQTWDQFIAALTDLIQSQRGFRTLVIDTIDSLEPLAWRKIMMETGAKSIELAHGGFGKGYKKALEMFLEARNMLDIIRSKGMNIILLAHTQTEKFFDPMTGAEFDRYKLKLHDSKNIKTSEIFTEWVDCQFFASYRLFKGNAGEGKSISMSDGSRVIYTEARPSHDAKNRFGMPPEITFTKENGYNDVMQYIRDFYNQRQPKQEVEPPLNGIDFKKRMQGGIVQPSTQPDTAPIAPPIQALFSEESKQLINVITEKVKALTIPALGVEIMKSADDAGNDINKLNEILTKLNIMLGVK